MSYFTNQSIEYIGATGIYPLFEFNSNSSNNIYNYSSNFNSEIESLKQKDISHDSSITSINSTISTIQTEVAANTTAIAGQATQISTLEATTAANVTAIAANTGAIIDLNLNKVNKSSFNSTGVIYMDIAGNVQLSYDSDSFSQYSVVTGNASVLTLDDTYKNLPTTIENINTNINNNYFTKEQTSNVLSNTSNNLYNNPNLQILSNIFVTSNVLSNTSNTLADYNNLYNKPNELTNISNIFVTSNVLSNTSNFLVNYNNLTNKPWIISGNNIYNNNTGNIGIGNTNPLYKLSVNTAGEFISQNTNKLIFSYDTNAYKHRISTTHDANSSTNNYFDFFVWRQGQGVNTDGDRHCLRLSATYTHFPSSTNKYFWINDANSVTTGYDHTTAPLTLFHKTPTSASVLNDSLPILNLAREGTSGQAWGARANFNICRWEHAGPSLVGSRTRLDLNLAHDNYDNVNVMTWRSDGNIGINKTTPLYKLDVNGTINATNLSIGTENVADNLQVKKLAVNRTITYPYTWFNPSESMFTVGTYIDVYSDFNNYNSNDYINLSTGVYGEGKLRLQGDGNTTLTGDTKLTLSSSNNIILSVSQGKNINLEGNVIFKNGVVVKKSPKYFTTSRTANFDGISCLAFDLDISTLTNYETIDSINFRHFRIKVFFASGVMSFQRTPRSFDISMSNYNGFSISCVESDGYFSELDRASNSNYFLYKQDFNKITACFPVSLFGSTNIKIAYILEDLLGK
jgi:hypothetical protein